MLAYILKLANYTGVDLEQAYLDKMKQNIGRDWQHLSDHSKTT
jgi:NTP pyrophosphatase (non-canonical NTP hydrolase)